MHFTIVCRIALRSALAVLTNCIHIYTYILYIIKNFYSFYYIDITNYFYNCMLSGSALYSGSLH